MQPCSSVTYLFRKSLGTVVDPGNIPASLRLIDVANTLSSEIFYEFTQSVPSGCVHVQVVSIRNVLLVYSVGEYSLCAMSTGE